MSDCVAVVPARGGSKGVSRKNLREIAGKPMVAYQIETAVEADGVDRVILSTDDDEIADVGREYGADVPFMRPNEMATDDVPVIAALKHAAEFVSEHQGQPEFTIGLQPTSPFTTPDQLDEAIKKAHSSECDSVVAVTKVTETHPYRAYHLDGDRIEPIEGVTSEEPDQRQDRPDVYGFTGAIYLRRTELLLEWEYDDFALGDDVRAVEQTKESAIEIDSEFDLRVARALSEFNPPEREVNQGHE